MYGTSNAEYCVVIRLYNIVQRGLLDLIYLGYKDECENGEYIFKNENKISIIVSVFLY